MRNMILLFSVQFMSISLLFADNYESAMSVAIENLNEAKNLDEYLDVGSTFERIGKAEQDKWHPFYYAGLAYVWTSHTLKEGNKIDTYLDKAQWFVEQAGKLSPNNDEIVTLQGYIYMMKVVVDPLARGPMYSGLSVQEFGRAIGMNPNNPRAVMLLGKMKMGTDQFFGNDMSESCGMILKASIMFDDQKVETKLDPSWGKEMAEMFVKDCQLN